MVTMEQVYNRAFEIWRTREMELPERVRRTKPDATDHATGAWARVVDQAAKELGWVWIAHGDTFEIPAPDKRL